MPHAPNKLKFLSCTYFIVNGKPPISLGGLNEKKPTQTDFRVGNTGMSQGFEALEQVVEREATVGEAEILCYFKSTGGPTQGL